MQQMALYQQLAAAQQLGGDVQYALLAQQQQQAVAAAGEAELPDLVIPHMFIVVLPVHLHTGWCAACLPDGFVALPPWYLWPDLTTLCHACCYPQQTSQSLKR